jgi:hypothetical protein
MPGWWGRQRGCQCGTCERCKRADYARRRWQNMTPEQRRAELATRDRERVRQQDAERAQRKRDDPYYRKRRAVANRVYRALKAGLLTRPDTCDRCGQDPGVARDGRPMIHAHHEDYDLPLDVTWLCTTCHGVEHRLTVGVDARPTVNARAAGRERARGGST